MMKDPLMIQIIDTKAMILNPALNELKNQCYEAVVSYIQGLLNNFIIAFVIFTIVLSICSLILLFIGFRSLRKIMWDTNIILKIIPFEAISRKNQMKIKEFFIS